VASFPRGGELLARPDAILRFQVNQDVGPAQLRRDLVLQLVRGPMRPLERGAGPELDVQVDVPL
jgi:hypothetical protein